MTGQSLTAVVIASLERQLEAERIARGGKSKAEWIREFVRKAGATKSPGSHSSRHAEIYGDDGLPI